MLTHQQNLDYQKRSPFQKHSVDIVANVVKGDRQTVEAAIAALSRQAVASIEG